MGVHDDKSRARLCAVQALYQMEQSGITAPDVIAQFRDHQVAGAEGEQVEGDVDFDLFSTLVTGAATDHSGLDGRISAVLQTGWALDRIDSVARAILRVGSYEIGTLTAPRDIVLNEYIEIAKAFFEGAEVGFINAALDRVSAPSEV